jgi:uncharacterized protein
VSERRVAAAAVLGVSLGLGLVIAGALVGRALLEARGAERYVTVKGLSERDVEADLVLWPLVFSATGEDLAAVQARLDADAERIREYLLANGFAAEEIGLSAPRVTDRATQGWDERGDRYQVEMTMTVRTSKVAAAGKAMQRSGELVKKGVTLVRSYEVTTQYLFTRLESVKPEMIAEATRDARRAAEQFAKDAGSELGSIRQAQQGYFSIEDRDAFTPEWKKVRVVTTVQFFLE